jgi:hypothetical protein
MSDDSHWLWRLSADAWLEAAQVELEQGRAQLGARRTAVTHARRAAGMALNAVLVTLPARGWPRERCEVALGRSYIDHLRALADPEHAAAKELRELFDPEQFARCQTLLGIPVMPPQGLIRLATRKDEAAHEAIAIASELTRACVVFVVSEIN